MFETRLEKLSSYLNLEFDSIKLESIKKLIDNYT